MKAPEVVFSRTPAPARLLSVIPWLALALAALVAVGAVWQHGRRGLRLEVVAQTADGSAWRVARSATSGLWGEDVARLRPSLATSVDARWSGVVRVNEPGRWRLRLRAEGTARLRLGGVVRLETGSTRGAARDDVELALARGYVPLELEWQVPAGRERLRLRRALDGGDFEELDPETLFQAPPGSAALWAHAALARVRAALPWALAAAAVALALRLVAGARGAPWGLAPATLRAAFQGGRGRALLAGLALVVVAWGVALRYEALIDSFWDTREWRSTETLRPLVVSLKPDAMRWPAQVPYVGGDPYAYLYYARHLRDFYQERVREPLFVYATHLALRVTRDNPVGVGVASAFFSALTVLGVFLLGARAFSPGTGLVAALGFAIEREVIALSIEGWRDDAFACCVVFFAWGALRFYERARFSDALVLGLAGGAAWLTRITSLTFLVPGFLALAVFPRGGARRARLERLSVAVLLCVALMTPFILNCWVALGDPFYAINEYTSFFRERSGHHDARPLNVVEYLLAFRPYEMADKAFIGYTAHPFAAKWNYAEWWPPLGPLLATASLAGLFLFLFVPRGRLLLLIHAGAMAPFVWAWDVPGGTPWRHTLHAYPFYLLAAGFVIDGGVRLLLLPRARAAASAWLTRRRRLALAATAAALALLAPTLAYGLHYGRVAEAIRAGGSRQYVMAGPRDAFFFGAGWHRPVHVWNWYARFQAAEEGDVTLPLVGGRAYRLTLRLDPFVPRPQRPQQVSLAWNGAPLTTLTLAYDAERTGEYTLVVPGERVRDGRNRLTLRVSRLEPASALRERPPAIPAGWRAALELRYVAVEEAAAPDSAPSL